MRYKNCDGKRIKSCDMCPHMYMDIMGGIACIEGLHHTHECKEIVSSSFEIPVECRLPDWKRTLEVKRD